MAAYLLAVCEITNPGPVLKEYSEKSAELIKQHGGEYILRGPAAQVVEGDVLNDKIAILSRFPSLEDVNAFVNGEDYQQNVKPLREGTGEYHIAFYEELPPEMT